MAMTFDQFTQWLRRVRPPIYTYPYRIEPCLCRDLNCHGWRLREVAIQPVSASHSPDQAQGDT